MNLSRLFQNIAFGLSIFISDALLKAFVHFNIPTMNAAAYVYPYDGIGVFHNWHGIDFCITHVINKGAAWGILASLQDYLLYARILVVLCLLAYLAFVKSEPFRKFCLTLIVAGASGNIIDYFVYGHVVDMFYFTFWGYSYPVFNIADSAIFCGIVLMLGRSFWQKVRRKNVSRAQA